MKLSSITTADLKKSEQRFDAAFHLSSAVSIRRMIQKQNKYTVVSVSDLTSRIFYGTRASRTYVRDKKNAIPFLTGASILLNNFDNTRLVSKKYTPAIEEMTLHEGWVLITRSGTVGQVAWSNKLFEGKYGSEDIIRVVPNGRMKGGVIYAFLASKYGNPLLTQGAFGAVIQHIEPNFVGDICLPEFDESLQNRIDKLVQEASSMREKADESRRAAIELFQSYLTSGIHKKIDVIASKQIFTHHHRLDAQYQAEVLLRKEDNLKLQSKPISYCAKKIYVGNRGKRYYVPKGLPFLSSSDMMLFNPEKWCYQISYKTPALGSLRVELGDILISRSGTVGNCIYVSEGLKNVSVSEHALRLRIDKDKISPQYVFAYLNTEQGQRKIKNTAYGSVIITLGEEFIGEIDLPELPDLIKEKIINLIDEYTSCSDIASQKDSEAIALMEKELETWIK